jgi:hypothetical protein
VKRTLTVVMLLAMTFVHAIPAKADLEFFGGVADLTFFYDRGRDGFDIVFRPSAANTDGWTGGTLYGNPPGGVGGSDRDRLFNSLHLQVTQPQVGTLNGQSYLTIGPASAAAPGRPDMGIRTRFRELQGDQAVDQFANFRMVLDWDASTKPVGSEFAMWNVDALGNPTIRFETNAGTLVSNWAPWGHNHWVYGFSQQGTYDLRFNIQGLDAENNPVTSLGSFGFSVTAVPEPTTTGLLAAGLGLMVMAMRKRRNPAGPVAESPQA